MFKRIFISVKDFILKISDDNISTYSAQASFFIIMSIFPFIMLLLTTIKFTPLTKSFLLSQAIDIMPDTIDPLIIAIIDELYSKAGSTLVSLSAILAIWSASRGVLSMIRGLNYIQNIDDKRNYFAVRLIASIYTIIFLVAILISLLLLVFGRSIYHSLEDSATVLYDILGLFMRQRLFISICILTLLFTVIYKALPAKKSSFLELLPGAIFSAIGWMISSYIFSIYIKYFPSFSYTYGSLSTFILLMLWIYAGMYILFLGSEINIYFNTHIESLLKRIKAPKLKT